MSWLALFRLKRPSPPRANSPMKNLRSPGACSTEQECLQEIAADCATAQLLTK